MRYLASVLIVLCACGTSSNNSASSASGSSGGSSTGSTGHSHSGSTGSSSTTTSSGGSSGGSTGPTADNFATKLSDEICGGAAATCCTAAGFAGFSADDCAIAVTEPWAEPGSGVFSATQAQACLDAYANIANCQVGGDIASACDPNKIFVGSVAAGGVCVAGSDCAGAESGAGVCMTYDLINYFCVSVTVSTVVGADCNQTASQSSPTQTICGSGFYCDLSTNKCAALVAKDSVCDEFDGCQAGLYCNDGGQCEPFLAAAAPCTADDTCVDGYACDDSNHCVLQVTANGACDNGADWAQCGADTLCDSMTNTCLSASNLASDDLCNTQ